MARPLTLALPVDLDLDETYQIRVTALDPTTGNTVAGVNVADVTLIVDNMGGGPLASGSFGPFMLVPGPNA